MPSERKISHLAAIYFPFDDQSNPWTSTKVFTRLLPAKLNATHLRYEVADGSTSAGSSVPAPAPRREPLPRLGKAFSFKELDEAFQAESDRCDTSSSPSQSLNEDPLDHGPSGRTEKRLPIILVVRLGHCESAGVVGEEKTYTDNISPHGARLFSKQVWRAGDTVQVTPLSDESVCGKVVYCQKMPDGICSIGVQFQARPVEWSVWQRFGGLAR